MATTRPSRTTKRWHCSASPLLWIILGLTSSLLLGLSYWQLSKGLHRLSEDQAQLKLAQKRATPYTIEESFIQWQQHPTSIQDSKVILDGQLQQSILLLHDNRILDGKAGYGIYGLLELPHTIQIAEYTHILVQIGWHPIPLFNRSIMPQLKLIKPSDAHTQRIPATLEHIFPNVFTLNEKPPELISQNPSEINDITTILRMQTIDFNAIDQTLNTKLLPFIARATEHLSEPSLPLNTQPIAKRGISAEKHFGYSVQWLIFWCIALGVFLYTQCFCYDSPQLTQPSED